jgi:hypothetical protein
MDTNRPGPSDSRDPSPPDPIEPVERAPDPPPPADPLAPLDPIERLERGEAPDPSERAAEQDRRTRESGTRRDPLQLDDLFDL